LRLSAQVIEVGSFLLKNEHFQCALRLPIRSSEAVDRDCVGNGLDSCGCLWTQAQSSPSLRVLARRAVAAGDAGLQPVQETAAALDGGAGAGPPPVGRPKRNDRLRMSCPTGMFPPTGEEGELSKALHW
jgi:hypothetical protein